MEAINSCDINFLLNVNRTCIAFVNLNQRKNESHVCGVHRFISHETKLTSDVPFSRHRPSPRRGSISSLSANAKIPSRVRLAISSTSSSVSFAASGRDTHCPRCLYSKKHSNVCHAIIDSLNDHHHTYHLPQVQPIKVQIVRLCIQRDFGNLPFQSVCEPSSPRRACFSLGSPHSLEADPLYDVVPSADIDLCRISYPCSRGSVRDENRGVYLVCTMIW